MSADRKYRRRRLATYICLSSLWVWLTVALAWPTLARQLDDTPRLHPPRAGGTDYLIVAPEALGSSARVWADYRRQQGYASQVLLLPPDGTTMEQIRDSIQQTYIESERPFPFYVLLLGHAHAASSFPASYVPAARLDVGPEYATLLGYDYIASDSAYAAAGDPFSPLLPIAVGRVPARTDEEALRVLERTRSYEAHPPSGAGRTQVELIASNSEFGPQFDRLIDRLVTFLVEEHLPPDYRWHMLYGNPNSNYTYPLEDFPNEVVRRLDQGALLVTYIGHGDSDWLGPVRSADGRRGRILDLDDLPLVEDASASAVMMIACSAGEYDAMGNTLSLAEALLLRPGGAVATYAASRLTVPAANTILGKDLFQVLLADSSPTAGEWIWRAESNFRNPGADRALSIWLLARAVPPVYIRIIESEREIPPLEPQILYVVQQHAYNLFGDAALALAHPKAELDVQPRLLWRPFGRQIQFTGQGDLPPGQTVTVSLDLPPGTIVSPDSNDIAARYARVNDKTVGQANTTSSDAGWFAGEIQLPPGLPSGRYLLRAIAVKGGATLVGTHSVYLGWPPVGDIITSIPFWWLIVSALLLWRLALLRRETSRVCDRKLTST